MNDHSGSSGSGRGGRRGEVLAALRSAGEPLSILDLADRLDLHANTVRFHLDALVGTHQVERVTVSKTGRGRPAQMFRAHTGMDPAGPRNYRLLADILVAQLAAEPDPARRALAAGRDWGRRLAESGAAPESATRAVGALVRTLDEMGFEPDVDTGAGQERILLRHCPFLEMTAARTAIVCPIHLGLMQGLLDPRHASVTVDSLEPFVEPDLCVAHLSVPAGRDTNR